MKPVNFVILLTMAALAVGVHAQDKCPVAGGASATQPAGALPPGHPHVATPDGAGSLPPGHPHVPAPAEGGALPPGHPAMPNASAPGAMPPGHPAAGPAGAKKPEMGSLTIRVFQGTKGGPTPVGDQVRVELYVAGQFTSGFDKVVDADGTATLKHIPLSFTFQPLVHVTHAGIDYMAMSEPIDADHPNRRMEVHVYETTDQQPQWQLQQRHAMLHRGDRQMDVVELLVLNNPSDRTWIGAKQPGDKPRVTLSLPLPAGAKDVKLMNGFAENASQMSDGVPVQLRNGCVESNAALTPGESRLQLAYSLPATDKGVELTFAAPAPTAQLSVVIPDDGATITPDGGLQTGERVDRGGLMLRVFKSGQIPAGQVAKLAIGNAAPAAVPAAGTMPQSDASGAAGSAASRMPQIVAMGAGGMLVIGTIAVLTRPGKSAKSGRSKDA